MSDQFVDTISRRQQGTHQLQLRLHDYSRLRHPGGAIMATQTKPDQATGRAAASGQPARPPAMSVLNPEHLKTSIDEIKAMGGPPPWNKTLVRNDRLTTTFIYQLPGTKNDHHYHLEDEWWYIAEGELAWEMEG